MLPINRRVLCCVFLSMSVCGKCWCHAAAPDVPPVRLVAGSPIPGQRLVLPYVRIKGKEFETETWQSDITRFAPRGGAAPSKKPSADAEPAVASTPGFQIGLKPGQIDFEVRPKGAEMLMLDAIMRTIPLGGPQVQQYLWKDQPYELLDRNRRVVYSYPKVEDLGEQRKPLVIPKPKIDGAFEMPDPDYGDVLRDEGEAETDPAEKKAQEEAMERKREEARRRAEETFLERHLRRLRRTFTSKSGQHSVDAVVTAIDETSAELVRMDDKKAITVKLQQLSGEDRVWLGEQKNYVQAFGAKVKKRLLESDVPAPQKKPSTAPSLQ